MLYDALSFILIIVCYLAFAATIFTMLFMIPDKVDYGSLTSSLRYMFDTMTGQNIGYIDDPKYVLSNSILMDVHVFIGNIFLLNYLVAIISQVYNLMMDTGNFMYKSNKY